jgi:16S rRNA (uracil1498-N3)-methyltransferase
MQAYYSSLVSSSGPSLLSEEESQHLLKVMRARAGQVLHVFDGQGNLYEAVLLSSQGKQAAIEVRQLVEQQTALSPEFHLVVAVPRHPDRWEWLLEKCTELGVSAIYPIITERTEKKNINRERAERILLAAAKQSGHWILPRLMPLSRLEAMDGEGFPCKLVAAISSDAKDFHDALRHGEKTMLLIGPEGDFSQAELKKLKEKGFQCISLGKSRLRLETAAVYSCAVFRFVNRW